MGNEEEGNGRLWHLMGALEAGDYHGYQECGNGQQLLNECDC